MHAALHMPMKYVQLTFTNTYKHTYYCCLVNKIIFLDIKLANDLLPREILDWMEIEGILVQRYAQNMVDI